VRLLAAAPRALNAFKVELAQRAIVRALSTLTSQPTVPTQGGR